MASPSPPTMSNSPLGAPRKRIAALKWHIVRRPDCTKSRLPHTCTLLISIDVRKLLILAMPSRTGELPKNIELQPAETRCQPRKTGTAPTKSRLTHAQHPDSCCPGRLPQWQVTRRFPPNTISSVDNKAAARARLPAVPGHERPDHPLPAHPTTARRP